MLERVYPYTPAVEAAYFVVTEQCNLRCKYCYETHGNTRMTLDVAKAGIDFLYRNSTKSSNDIDVTFFGGEPTLECDLIVDTMEYGYKVAEKYGKPIVFGFVTNCVSLPAKLYDAILKHGRNHPINVQLSIDGPDMIQDAYRVFPDGSGSWSTVSKTLDKWKQLFKEMDNGFLSVHGCFNTTTLPDMYASYLYFRDERGIKNIWNIPVAEQEWLPEHIDLYRKQLTMIKEHIIMRCEETGSDTEAGRYSPLNRCLGDEDTERGKPCSAGETFVSITPAGDLSPCHQMHFNVENSSIGNVWDGIDNDKRRLFVEYDESDFPCNSKGCENTTCFRCIAHNFDERQNMFAIHSDSYCKMMTIDRQVQGELREYLRSNNGTGKKV